jgi:hypothetical protein
VSEKHRVFRIPTPEFTTHCYVVLAAENKPVRIRSGDMLLTNTSLQKLSRDLSLLIVGLISTKAVTDIGAEDDPSFSREVCTCNNDSCFDGDDQQTVSFS